MGRRATRLPVIASGSSPAARRPRLAARARPLVAATGARAFGLVATATGARGFAAAAGIAAT
ncbi:hypothetical protein, partial [Achromobacter ruhlandii]|uniref:hypothetical protein n=1 Tax=Achromobacter ruhlandii TaxID=72557 RepID=UPI0022B920FB